MSQKRILIVEDEEDILELISYNLSREGYQVAGVTSGEKALKKIKSEPYDLIVLDLMLPGIDGLEVAKVLKKDAKTNNIPYSHEQDVVKVSAFKQDREVIISVQDYGIGISKEHLSRLFERFYRVDKARSRSLGGTGLGLAIVKHIAHAHGGRVSVDSTPGKGSTFSLHLPNH